MLLFVGTYTTANKYVEEGRGAGICVFEVDDAAGTITRKEDATIDAGPNPSFITISNNGKWLYAVNEGITHGTSCVVGYKIEGDGSSTRIGEWGVSGTGPCHVSISQNDSIVWVACYISGTMTCYSVDQEDGTLMLNYFEKFQAATDTDSSRQKNPHAHACVPSPCEKWVYVTNLGGDRLYKYKIDAELHLSKPTESSTWIQTPPGSGPRHVTFHPSLPIVYVACELSNQVIVYRKSPQGCLEQIQIIGTLPKHLECESYAGDIHCTPDGNLLYVSNRGHDTLAGFRIHSRFGTLISVGFTPARGGCPRNFVIHPTGSVLLVANQDTDNIVLFWIDGLTGELVATGFEVDCASPTCLKLLPTEEMRREKEKTIEMLRLNIATHVARRKGSI